MLCCACPVAFRVSAACLAPLSCLPPADEDDENALLVGDVKYVQDATGQQAAKWNAAWRFKRAAAPAVRLARGGKTGQEAGDSEEHSFVPESGV